jgi:hypothetical protein
MLSPDVPNADNPQYEDCPWREGVNSIGRRIKGDYACRLITIVFLVIITFTGAIMTTTTNDYFTIKFAYGHQVKSTLQIQ